MFGVSIALSTFQNNANGTCLWVGAPRSLPTFISIAISPTSFPGEVELQCGVCKPVWRSSFGDSGDGMAGRGRWILVAI